MSLPFERWCFTSGSSEASFAPLLASFSGTFANSQFRTVYCWSSSSACRSFDFIRVPSALVCTSIILWACGVQWYDLVLSLTSRWVTTLKPAWYASLRVLSSIFAFSEDSYISICYVCTNLISTLRRAAKADPDEKMPLFALWSWMSWWMGPIASKTRSMRYTETTWGAWFGVEPCSMR